MREPRGPLVLADLGFGQVTTGQVPLAEPLNVELWNSATRILSGGRLHAFGQGYLELADAGVIPEDVAAVVAHLRETETRSLRGMVVHLREFDGAATEDARRRGVPIPAGGSLFEPVYNQYLELAAVPPLPDEVVWYGMPAEMYLANRLRNPSAFDLEMLREIGYVRAYEKGGAGESVYSADPGLIAKSAEVSYLLGQLPQIKGAAAIPAGIAVIQTSGRAVWILLGVAGIVAGAGAVGWTVVKPWLEAKVVTSTVAAGGVYNKGAFDWNGRIAEQMAKYTDYCIAQAAAAGTRADHCAAAIQRAMPFVQPLDPGSVARQAAGLLSCDSASCWGWTAAGAAIGALAGAVAAHKWKLGGGS